MILAILNLRVDTIPLITFPFNLACCSRGAVSRESTAQFENRIKPREYVRRITRSTVQKSSILLARTGVRKISSVACEFSPLKILILITCRINEVYVFFNKMSLKYKILLLLIYCLMYFPLFVGVLCLSLFC